MDSAVDTAWVATEADFGVVDSEAAFMAAVVVVDAVRLCIEKDVQSALRVKGAFLLYRFKADLRGLVLTSRANAWRD